jgi:hypothetical protein
MGGDSQNTRHPARGGWARIAVALCMLITLALGMAPGAAVAQGPALSTSYITPFPDNNTYRLEVWGDVLAEGLLTGLVEQLADEPRVSVQRRHRPIHSLLRGSFEEDISEIVSELARSNAHIIIIQIGLNDRYPMRLANGRRAPVGSDVWQQEYGRRLDRIIRAFRAQRIAVYWVGLPIVRRPDISDELQAINGVLRERAYAAGQKMIDIYAATANQDGRYDPYGPDLTGTSRLLRQADGITFTQAGSRKVAHFVERELKRDLVQARAQRSIPLAGSEAEQRIIRPLRASPQPATSTRTPDASATGTKATARPAQQSTEGELKADSSRVAITDTGASGRQEAATIELPRPAIPGSLMALLARRNTSDRTSQPGEVLVREIPGGLTLSRTISTAATPGVQPRRALPSQTPFFRVLVKGERLEPKDGRADDITWPPISRPVAPTPPMTPAATEPAPAQARQAPQPIPRPAPR